MNLIEALQAKNDEYRRFIAELEETAKLLGKGSADEDPGLAMSKLLNLGFIRMNEAAIASGDSRTAGQGRTRKRDR